MNELIQSTPGSILNTLSGWDWLIAGVIVLAVEYGVKSIFKEDKFKMIWKLAPIILGVVGYAIYGLIVKTNILQSVIRGAEVGFVAMGYYDIILKTMKTSGKDGITKINEEVKKSVTGETKG